MLAPQEVLKLIVGIREECSPPTLKPIYNVTEIGPNTYQVIVTDTNNCTASSNIQKVNVYCLQPSLTAVNSSGAVDTAFLSDSTLMINIVNGNYSGGSNSDLAYSWSPDSAFINTRASIGKPKTPIAPGLDTFRLTIRDTVNKNGCIVTIDKVIFIRNFGDFKMATAFTPNGDGINERFFPITGGKSSPSKITAFKIYNRWGELVYDSVDPMGWDGTFKGTQQPSDTYLYFVTVETPR